MPPGAKRKRTSSSIRRPIAKRPHQGKKQLRKPITHTTTVTVKQTVKTGFKLSLSVGCEPPKTKGRKRPATGGKNQVRPKAKRRKVTSEPTRGGEGRKQTDTAGEPKPTENTVEDQSTTDDKAGAPEPAEKVEEDQSTTDDKAGAPEPAEKVEEDQSTTQDTEDQLMTFNWGDLPLKLFTVPGAQKNARRTPSGRMYFYAVYRMLCYWRAVVILAKIALVCCLSTISFEVCTPTPTNETEVSRVQALTRRGDALMCIVSCCVCIVCVDMYMQKACNINNPTPCNMTAASMHVISRMLLCSLLVTPLIGFVWPIAYYGSSFYLDAALTLLKQHYIGVFFVSFGMPLAALVITNDWVHTRKALNARGPNHVATHAKVATLPQRVWKFCGEQYPDAKVVPQVVWTIGIGVAIITLFSFVFCVALMHKMQITASVATCAQVNNGWDFGKITTPNVCADKEANAAPDKCATTHMMRGFHNWGPCETFQNLTESLSWAVGWGVYFFQNKKNTPGGMVNNLGSNTHWGYDQTKDLKLIKKSEETKRTEIMMGQLKHAEEHCESLGLDEFSDATLAMIKKMCEIFTISNVILSWFVWKFASCKQLIAEPNVTKSEEYRSSVTQTLLSAVGVGIGGIVIWYVTSFILHHTGPIGYMVFAPPLYYILGYVLLKFEQYTFTAAFTSIWGWVFPSKP